MQIVSGEEVAKYVSDLTGYGVYPPYTAVGNMNKKGEIVAGCLFNCFEEHDMHATIAGKGWTKGLMAELGNYAYGTLGLLRVTIICRTDEHARLACRTGGEIEGRMRDHFGKGKDAIIVGVLKDDWRW